MTRKQDRAPRITDKQNGEHVERTKARLDQTYGKRRRGKEAPPVIEAVKDEPGTAGGPSLHIDERVLAGLAAIQCTYSEMAAVLGCDESTLRRRYAALVEKEREAGLMSLRRAQFSKALGGSVPMLIWLGKQYLGQREKLAMTGEDGGPVEVNVLDARQALLVKLAAITESVDALPIPREVTVPLIPGAESPVTTPNAGD